MSKCLLSIAILVAVLVITIAVSMHLYRSSISLLRFSEVRPENLVQILTHIFVSALILLLVMMFLLLIAVLLYALIMSTIYLCSD